MRRIPVAILFFICLFVACKQNTESNGELKSDGIHFGEMIDTAGTISYTDLLSKMVAVDSFNTKVTGKVSGVCQAKGCWMNIVSDKDSTKTEMFVQFKDYGFFMPKDLAGKEVVMKGKAYKELTSVEDLRHFAEDEGLSKEEIEKITEPKKELKFMASGVLIK